MFGKMTEKITFESTLKRLSNLPEPEKMSDDDKKFYSELGAALLKIELEMLIAKKQCV